MNEAREHCWHEVGEVSRSHPPRTWQQCCYCGQTRTIGQKVVPPAGHGPHAPASVYEDTVEGGDGPCVPTTPPEDRP